LSFALQEDGKILLGGLFSTLRPNGAFSPTARNFIARVNVDGTLDSSFDPKPNSHVSSLAVQADGKILIGGEYTTLQPNWALSATARNYIARVNADGTLDPGFDPKPNGIGVYSLALQVDGKILLGGVFTALQPNGAVSATMRNYIARVNADGTLDTSFDPSPNGSAFMLVQADGKILLGGQLTTLRPNGATSSIPRSRFARLNNDSVSQTLSVPNATQLLWQRGGAAPEISQVTFELSIDGGTIWTALGNGVRIGTTANWQLTGLSLPAAGQIRARGRTTGGRHGGSSGLVEQVQVFSGLLPEMAVSGNSVKITDGDSTPSTSDHSDFGNVNVIGGSLVRTFTVANTGIGTLNLSGTPKVVIGGTNATDFSVSVQPTSPVAAAGSTTFQVAFVPGAVGLRSATLSIANAEHRQR
jgi:uncharacterized delta-60 repeat protein